MPQDWEREVDALSSELQARLERCFTRLQQTAPHPFLARDASFARDLVLRGGKRIMSASALMAYRGFRGEVDEPMWKVAVALELWRHAILLHDDVVDRDHMRRGGPSFHIMGAGERDARFGEANALFYGSALAALALQRLLRAPLADGQRLRAVERLTRNARDVNESQVLDLLFEYTRPGEKEWYAMARLRAAALFEMALGLGAELGGAPQADAGALERAGVEMGYAFDIQDDIIGSFATENGYGRPPGGDLDLGKKPLYAVMAMERLGGEDLAALKRELDKRRSGPADRVEVKRLVEACGALRDASARCREHAQRATELIRSTSMRQLEKDALAGLIDYVATSLEWYR